MKNTILSFQTIFEYLKGRIFCGYLFSRAEKKCISWVFIFANQLFLELFLAILLGDFRRFFAVFPRIGDLRIFRGYLFSRNQQISRKFVPAETSTLKVQVSNGFTFTAMSIFHDVKFLKCKRSTQQATFGQKINFTEILADFSHNISTSN